MSDKALIEVAGVSRYYGRRCALKDVSFAALNGEITGFLGPNGAGKSTLMQIICGVMAPTSGNVRIAGLDLLDDPLKARANLGFLPEQPPLYPDCTVDEYLHYCAKLRRVSRSKIREQVNTSREKCGLANMGNRLIGNLSKGYQQRVGLAQAIVHMPQVLVLDEPGSGLDPGQTLEMRALIRDIGEDHCVILSTHILGEAQGLCDRILIINQGEIVLDRPLTDLPGAETSGKVIIVRLTSPPDPLEKLTEITGIESVTNLGEKRFRLGGNTNDTAGIIAGAAATNKWGLTELVSESTSLEQVYIQLTSGT